MKSTHSDHTEPHQYLNKKACSFIERPPPRQRPLINTINTFTIPTTTTIPTYHHTHIHKIHRIPTKYPKYPPNTQNTHQIHIIPKYPNTQIPKISPKPIIKAAALQSAWWQHAAPRVGTLRRRMARRCLSLSVFHSFSFRRSSSSNCSHANLSMWSNAMNHKQ